LKSANLTKVPIWFMINPVGSILSLPKGGAILLQASLLKVVPKRRH
jgi:hypothetical protein